MPKPKYAQPKLVNIEINGIPLQVPEGEPLVEAAKRVGADIPIFCYHKYMQPVGMCRMCLVEIGYKQPDGSVRKMPKPQTSCTLPCTEGLVAWTETEQIIKDRRAILEFLLINHPLDCPICDRGGECPLQNNTQFYGPSTSRYIEVKRHLPKAFPLSKYVMLDLERCIQCGRCVRFTEEVSGDSQLAFLFRGAQTQPHTFQLTEFTSHFSGNVIEICPVGALTSRTYRFRARPWDITTQKSICTMCSNGCNLYVDSRAGRVVRINARENPLVNETWTCDKGKFEQTYMHASDRLLQPMVRRGKEWEPIRWSDAYDLLLERWSALSGNGRAVAGLAGHRLSNESLYLFQKLLRGAFQTNHIDHRFTRYQGALCVPTTQNEYRDLEAAALVFVFGMDLIDEQPMVFLRLRKACRRYEVQSIVAYPVPNAAEEFATLCLRYRPGSEDALLKGLLHVVLEQLPTLPAEAESLKAQLADCTPAWTAEQTGVPAETLMAAAQQIAQSPSMVILAGEKVWNHPRAHEVVEWLQVLNRLTGNDTREEGGLNLMPTGANQQGAWELGVVPHLLPGYALVEDAAARARFEQAWGVSLPATAGLSTDGILQACLQGEVQLLYIAGADLIGAHYEPALAERALRACAFVVVQDVQMTETARYADLLLPACPFTEYEGTFTNWERRVQRFWQAHPPQGEAKPDWQVFAELWLRIRRQVPPFSAREVMEEIARLVPAFAPADYARLGEEGVRLGV
ncbi:MAG: NADH-quinone oxidoreductase subunit NuoG [Fimbriimonadales bacterium]|nr:NADH-quinone oxidoreductase subunit NuoG [Fimbriimonadales bacterium]MDW8050983.1 NADH-quinone oxidoreductase subunit NuoG [Armatimonadota bacterium]